MSFQLDPRLAQGGFNFGTIGICQVILKDNAVYPWFILVPEVDSTVTDLHHLSPDTYQDVTSAIYTLSQFVESAFKVKKINVGAIGNIVPQLHIHVIGRTDTDPDWPQPVWGTQHKSPYLSADVESIRENYRHFWAT